MFILPHKYKELLIDSVNQSIRLTLRDNIKSYFDLIESLDSGFNDAIRHSLVTLIEQMDHDYLCSDERKNLYYTKGKRRRTICTIFGEISFKREYYVDKQSGDGFFYVDQVLSLPYRDYYDPFIKAMVVANYAEHSYSVSGEITSNLIGDKLKDLKKKVLTKISRQTVFNIVHQAKLTHSSQKVISDIETIYIQLDEKYIHTQSNNNASKEIKIAVTYTDKELVYNKRYALKNRYIVTSNASSYDLIKSVQDYIYSTFDVNKLKKIIILGDGANWIKSTRGEFKFTNKTETIFILDKFHTHQAINHITKDDELKYYLRDYIINNDLESFNQLIEITKKKDSNRVDMITEKQTYLSNNWTFIQNQKNVLNLGCSIEGHVSHVLAAKLTSRPKAYKLNRIKQTLDIRTLHMNGDDLYNNYLNNNTSRKTEHFGFKQLKEAQPILNILGNGTHDACQAVRLYSF